MKAKRKHATVMFTDIDGFTAISKEIGAEQAYAIVTRCLKLLDAIARKHGGSVDNYLVDAIMAVFGYPVPLDNAARSAATAAIEMRGVLRESRYTGNTLSSSRSTASSRREMARTPRKPPAAAATSRARPSRSSRSWS